MGLEGRGWESGLLALFDVSSTDGSEQALG